MTTDTTTCEACQNDEHGECSDPEETRMERDTGWHNVVRCCCAEADDDGPADDDWIYRAYWDQAGPNPYR